MYDHIGVHVFSSMCIICIAVVQQQLRCSTSKRHGRTSLHTAFHVRFSLQLVRCAIFLQVFDRSVDKRRYFVSIVLILIDSLDPVHRIVNVLNMIGQLPQSTSLLHSEMPKKRICRYFDLFAF